MRVFTDESHNSKIFIIQRMNNFYLVTVPYFLCFLVIFVVTVYVIKIIIKQESTVTPLVTLPNRGVEGSSKPRVFSISQGIDINVQHPTTSNIQHNNHTLLEDLEIKTPQETNENPNVSRRQELIRRDEASPHIFYRPVVTWCPGHNLFIY